MSDSSLNDLKKGESAKIKQVEGDDGIAIRLMEMGMISGEEVEFVGKAPLGEPATFVTRGFRLALRSAEASRVQVDSEV